MLGFGPKLLKEIDTSQYLNGRPKDNNCGDGHADIGSPCAQTQLLSEDEETTYQTSCGNNRSYRMMVTEEVLVVAEHQQEIACPQNHVQFHESNDTCMMRHRTGGNLVLA